MQASSPCTSYNQQGTQLLSMESAKSPEQLAAVEAQKDLFIKEIQEATKVGDLQKKAQLAFSCAKLLDRNDPNNLGNLTMVASFYLMAFKANPSYLDAGDQAKIRFQAINKLQGKTA